MDVCTTIQDLRRVRASAGGERVTFVPTMGALHEGHLTLIREASSAGIPYVSIFVNPTQFRPGEDFDAYPRLPEQDLEMCRTAGVRCVFMPSAGEIYPEPSALSFTISGLADHMCGATRKGHFEGVCQVVNKLFNLVQPDEAYFGQKDIQQYIILERMVHDLNIPVGMRMVPTVRETDGLAMSSRNRYLTRDERRTAPAMFNALEQIRIGVFEQGRHLNDILRPAEQDLVSKGFAIEYLGIFNRGTLQPSDGPFPSRTADVGTGWIIAAAARLGQTRLIDNLLIPSPSER